MKKKRAVFLIDNLIYNEAILIDAVNVLSNKYIIEIARKNNKTHLIVTSRFSDLIDDNFRDELFDNLNDQKIRNKINKEVQKVRDLIVGKALYETGSFDNESEIYMKEELNHDFIDDKDKIAEIYK
jgi:His-Xaa-Ser system protein HxsD